MAYWLGRCLELVVEAIWHSSSMMPKHSARHIKKLFNSLFAEPKHKHLCYTSKKRLLAVYCAKMLLARKLALKVTLLVPFVPFVLTTARMQADGLQTALMPTWKERNKLAYTMTSLSESASCFVQLVKTAN